VLLNPNQSVTFNSQNIILFSNTLPLVHDFNAYIRFAARLTLIDNIINNVLAARETYLVFLFLFRRVEATPLKLVS